MRTDELERFEMAAPRAWLQAVDHWRAKQDDIPSRQEAIRRLVESSLSLLLNREGSASGLMFGMPTSRGWVRQSRGLNSGTFRA